MSMIVETTSMIGVRLFGRYVEVIEISVPCVQSLNSLMGKLTISMREKSTFKHEMMKVSFITSDDLSETGEKEIYII